MTRPGARHEPSPQPKPGAGAVIAALALAALTFATFAPALGHGFLDYDDDLYVTGNRDVQAGLTWEGVRWAFTTGHAANWHPLTWLTHMADVELWALDASGHHLTSLLLHAANTALVFLVLRSLTGAFWPSALVAALFGLHPTRIESVAWVAERKDVLSALFALLALLAYGAWTRRPTRGRYTLALLAFAAGLSSKPMLVTLPFVLVLLDTWPLRRASTDSLAGRLAEKWPFFLMAGASSVVTLLVQRAAGAVGSIDAYPLGVRLANAVFAYAGYLRRLVWPAGLSVFYPHPGPSLTAAQIAGAAALVAGLCLLAFGGRRERPHVFVGWLWFSGMMVPIIGLVQVGSQALADRYTYLPYLGLLLALAGLAADWVERVPRRRGPVAAALGVALVAGCALATRSQLRHWHDSETLFRRALAVTSDNYLAHHNLAHHLNDTNRPAEAIPHLEQALRIRPRYAPARMSLGRALFVLGRLDEAAGQFEQAAVLRPEDPLALNSLAYCRLNQGELAEAVRVYTRVLALKPDWAEVLHRAGTLQIMEGDWAGGGERLRRAATLQPLHPDYAAHARGFGALSRDRADPPADGRRLRDDLVVAHRQTAAFLGQRGRRGEALDQLQKAVRLDPGRADLQAELGAALSLLGRPQEAIGALETAVQLAPDDVTARNNLGFLLFQQGRRQAAIAQFREALRIAPDFPLARKNLALAEGRRPPAGR